MTTSKVAGNSAVSALSKAAAESAHRSRDWFGFCLMFVRTCLGIPKFYDEAEDAWAGALHKHTTGTPPAGSAIFYAGGQHGHVTLSAGGGMCWSTDLLRRGQVDKVPVNAPVAKWGYRYLGWTEDLNGYSLRLPKPMPPVGTWVAYTIERGDTLESIAAGIHASVANIVAKNRVKLDAAARRYGRPNSANGQYIYPGTVISVPHGFPGQR
jgi:hypothetical protein